MGQEGVACLFCNKPFETKSLGAETKTVVNIIIRREGMECSGVEGVRPISGIKGSAEHTTSVRHSAMVVSKAGCSTG